MGNYADNYLSVLSQLQDTCKTCSRDLSEVKLLAVSKTVDVNAVLDVMNVGANAFGENRPDSLLEKYSLIPNAEWHFIGNIQSRRIPDIVRASTLIHSLYETRHIEKIDRAAKENNKTQDVLLEINISGEESKGGVSRDEAFYLLENCLKASSIRVRGLMTMARANDPEDAKRTFSGLRELLEELSPELNDDQQKDFCELSMGMSDDWKIGVQEGATIVRVGRAIFS